MRYNFIKKKKSLDSVMSAPEIWNSEEIRYKQRTLTDKSQQLTREGMIALHVSQAVADHLGVFKLDNLSDKINTGVDRAIEYFLGDWWRNNETDRTYLDKSHPERALIWSGPYLHAAFLCGLTKRWGDLQRVSEWIDESVYPEITFGSIDDEFSLFLLYVASCLRDSPLSIHDTLCEAIEKGRPKAPRLLLNAFRSAVDSDQKSFEKAIIASLQNCEKSEIEDVPNFNYWVGIPQSFISAVAERNGLFLPELPPNLDALLVRRSTINL